VTYQPPTPEQERAHLERWRAEIQQQLQELPPLTPEQVRAIRALLRPRRAS
jgi:hypothetical protein